MPSVSVKLVYLARYIDFAPISCYVMLQLYNIIKLFTKSGELKYCGFHSAGN